VSLVSPTSFQGGREGREKNGNFDQSNLKLLILAVTVIFNYPLDVNRLLRFESDPMNLHFGCFQH
jgi:hypothetical protein